MKILKNTSFKTHTAFRYLAMAYLILWSLYGSAQNDSGAVQYSSSFSAFLKKSGYKSIDDIKNLTISDYSSRDDIFTYLKDFKNLSSVVFRIDNVSAFNEKYALQTTRDLAGLPGLKYMAFESDKATTIPGFPAFELGQVKDVLVALPHLEVIPGTLAHFRNIERLAVHSQNLERFPDIFGSFSQLKDLWITSPKLKEIPPSVSSLTALKYLYIFEADFSSLPDFLHRLPNLENLGMDVYGLKMISDSFFNHFNSRNVLLSIDLFHADSLEEIDFGAINFKKSPFGRVNIHHSQTLKSIKNLSCSRLFLKDIDFTVLPSAMKFRSAGNKCRKNCEIDTLMLEATSLGSLPKKIKRFKCAKSLLIYEIYDGSDYRNPQIISITEKQLKQLKRKLRRTEVRIVKYQTDK